MANTAKRNTEVTVGELESGKPYAVDLVNNPVVTIVGGSGAGKSHLTYSIVESLVKTNTPETLNVVLLDEKGSYVWKGLAVDSHFKGYHTDPTTFISVLEDVKEEHARRVKELASKGFYTWEEYVANDKEKALPVLLVVIDELTETMTKLREDEESYTRFRKLLVHLAGVIRTSGIKIIIAGQRALDNSIPRGYLGNTSLKVGMKMNGEKDYTAVFGIGWKQEDIKLPQRRQECIVTSREYPTPTETFVGEVHPILLPYIEKSKR